MYSKMLSRCCSINYWWDLPDDVKVGIMSRLSEKDLIASKLVSKEWNFMISSICIPSLSPPNSGNPFWGFLCFENPPPLLEPGKKDPDPEPYPNGNKYIRLGCAPTKHFYKETLYQSSLGKLTMHDRIMSLLASMEHDPSHIIDSCNGLLLLSANSQSYFVGNPVTSQRIAIPLSNHPESIHSSLVFDPSISLHFKVFRYTRSAVEATPCNPLALEIFSSDSGKWSSHVLPLEPHNLYGSEWIKRSVYFDGTLYYMSMAMYLVCIDNAILKPALDGGQYLKTWAVELPDRDKITIEQGNKGLHGCIGCSLGRFYYSNRDSEGAAILVWMLVGKGKHSGWVLKHSIKIDCDVVPVLHNVKKVNYYKKLDTFRPRAFHPNDDEIILACPRAIVSYHLKTKCTEVSYFPWMYRRKTLLLDHNWIFPYSRSLVSLKTIASDVEAVTSDAALSPFWCN